jgi:hypothetical protein
MVIKRFEEVTGLPPLSKIVDTVDKLPDNKRLNSIKEILILAEKASQIVPELDKVVSLVTVLNDLPLEKLKAFEKILKRLEAMIDKAPDDLIKTLIQFLNEINEG